MYGPWSDSGQGSRRVTTESFIPVYKKTISVTNTPLAWSLSGMRTGVVTAGYAYKVTHGVLLPQNVFGMVKRYSTSTRGFSRSVMYTTGGKLSSITCTEGDLVNPNTYAPAVSDLVSAAELANNENRAVIKLRTKLKDSSVNVAVAMAESDQAFKMIGDRLRVLRRSWSAMKRGDLRMAARVLGSNDVIFSKNVTRFARNPDPKKAINSAILEIQYGWRPLLSDIYGALEHVEKRAKAKPNVLKVSVRSSVDREVISTSPYGFHGLTTTVDKVKRDYTVACLYKVSSPVLSELSQLGITNPALVAWEKIPWSFVVDWICHIGNYLSQFDSTFGLEFISGYETTFDESSRRVNSTDVGWKTAYNYVEVSREATATKVDVSRSALISTPISVLPVFKNPLSLEHSLNASALLFQTLRK